MRPTKVQLDEEVTRLRQMIEDKSLPEDVRDVACGASHMVLWILGQRDDPPSAELQVWIDLRKVFM